MSTRRVTAPPPPADGQKVMGPPAYFPSIEAKYGKPMQEWFDFVVERLDAGDRHMEVVAMLKSEHGMGHGHANAVVGFVRRELGEA
jgi:hypothetical protein